MGNDSFFSNQKDKNVLECKKQLGKVIPNIALMLQQSAEKFAEKTAFQDKHNDKYVGISWTQFYNNIINISYNLKQFDYTKGDKFVIFSENRLEMLEFELAVMASGGVAVPIFF